MYSRRVVARGTKGFACELGVSVLLPLACIFSACNVIVGNEEGIYVSKDAAGATDTASSTSSSSGSSGASSSGATSSSGGTNDAGADAASTADGGGKGDACNPFLPCAPDLYCDSVGCGAGTCQPRATSEDSTHAPVCGCDGITYWNSTLATKIGVSIRASSPCGKTDSNSAKCNSLNANCPTGSSCGLITVQSACTNVNGVCWTTPATCPASPVMVVCSGSCQSICTSIKAELPYYQTTSCP